MYKTVCGMKFIYRLQGVVAAAGYCLLLLWLEKILLRAVGSLALQSTLSCVLLGCTVLDG